MYSNDFSEELDSGLEHYGVPGMRWGVRSGPRPSNSEIKNAQREVRQLRKAARSSIKTAYNAKTAGERKAAIDRYKKEVADKINSKEFKDTWNKANRQTRGQMTAQILLLGPVGVVTMAGVNSSRQKYGLSQEKAVAKQVLDELKEL